MIAPRVPRDQIGERVAEATKLPFKEGKNVFLLGKALRAARYTHKTYSNHKTLRTGAYEQRLRDMQNAAYKLLELMTVSPGDLIGKNLDERLPTSIFLADLEAVYIGCRDILAERDAEGAVKVIEKPSGSAFERLVANRLVRIYEEFFREAARSKTIVDGVERSGGPFIRFAATALAELKISNNGEPYTGEAIASALQQARSGGRPARGRKPAMVHKSPK